MAEVTKYKIYKKQSDKSEYNRVGAWFLGPKAENSDLLLTAITESIKSISDLREQNYNKDDPKYITEEMKKTPEYIAAVKTIKKFVAELNTKLTFSVPFFSPRYQAHMLWDLTLPAALGYISAMFYNQNNVASEASPVTSKLEIEVGTELCQLNGYYLSDDSDSRKQPWGHITADGTIANLESMWVARNIKYFPVALRSLLNEKNSVYSKYKDTPIRVWPDETKKPLHELTRKEILRLKSDDVLNFVETIADLCYPGNPVAVSKVMADSSVYTIQTLGFRGFNELNNNIIKQDIILAPATRHYSWPKSAAILGLGEQSVIKVNVDNNCRMDINDLKNKIAECESYDNTILMIVVVAGSTAEGAMDYLDGVLNLRDQKHFSKMNYLIHVDAAWGGYVKTILPDPHIILPFDSAESPYVPTLTLSHHAQKQYRLFRLTDSVTIDPHKAGYVPYPAGCLCYRDGRFRYQINMSAPYLLSEEELNVGSFGVEGSKPGAAAAAVWLSHKCISLDTKGYGLILGECMFSVKIYYCYWLLLPKPDDPFIISMVHPLPTYNRKPFDTMNEDEIKKYISENIIGKSNEEIEANNEAMHLLSEIGPDILINAFVFNFKNDDGSLNKSIDKINLLTSKILDRYSITKPPEVIKDIVVLIMGTEYSSTDYQVVVDRMTKYLGIVIPKSNETFNLKILSSTILNPWPTVSDFPTKITTEVSKGIKEIIEEIKKTP